VRVCNRSDWAKCDPYELGSPEESGLESLWDTVPYIATVVAKLQCFLIEMIKTTSLHRSSKSFELQSHPLVPLTTLTVPWKWGKEQQEAFEEIKKVISKDTMLAFPRLDKPFHVYTDTR
jgi:RNase H-like domain found in reverse transcriptase